MSAETTQEPTMEEILASIRRIISEEDAPAAAAPPPVEEVLELKVPAPAPEPIAAAPEPAPVTHSVAPEPMPQIEDLDVIDVVEQFQDSDAEALPTPHMPDLEEGLIGQPAMESAIGALGRLAAHMPISDNPNQTLEGLVQEMLRPMLKQWLDANLPRIVEEKVEAEIVRLARVVRRAR